MGPKKRSKSRSSSPCSMESRISKQMKYLHQQHQQHKQDAAKSAYSWLNNRVENGYILHPKAGWIIHPSFYDEDKPLCDAKSVCVHQRDCKEVRMRMAVYQYIRAEQKNTPLSYREVELLWGVSHSTVQRRKMFMQAQSNVLFLITPFKKLGS